MTISVELIYLAAAIGLVISNIKLWIELEAMKRSTHQVTYLDPTADALKEFAEHSEFSNMNDDVKAALKGSQSADMDIVA